VGGGESCRIGKEKLALLPLLKKRSRGVSVGAKTIEIYDVARGPDRLPQNCRGYPPSVKKKKHCGEKKKGKKGARESKKKKASRPRRGLPWEPEGG